MLLIRSRTLIGQAPSLQISFGLAFVLITEHSLHTHVYVFHVSIFLYGKRVGKKTKKKEKNYTQNYSVEGYIKKKTQTND